MNKLSIIITIILFNFCLTFSQNIDGKEIKNRELEWSDFVGKVDKTSKWDAFTSWVTTYSFPSPTIKGEKVYVALSIKLFLKNISWVKAGKQTERLLNHERGHYNLGRICAKQIEETINSSAFDKNDYHKQIDSLYWQIIEQCKALDKQYDSETNHFQNQSQQALWDKKIRDLLN